MYNFSWTSFIVQSKGREEGGEITLSFFGRLKPLKTDDSTSRKKRNAENLGKENCLASNLYFEVLVGRLDNGQFFSGDNFKLQ